MRRLPAHSVLVACLLLACDKPPVAPTSLTAADAGPLLSAIAPNGTCDPAGCGLEDVTLEATIHAFYAGRQAGDPTNIMVGEFSCESALIVNGWSGTGLLDGDPPQGASWEGRAAMYAAPPLGWQPGEPLPVGTGPFEVAGSVSLPDGAEVTGFFTSEWVPAARTCTMADGVMRIVINTRGGAAVARIQPDGRQGTGGAVSFISGYVDVAPDLTVLGSKITMRLIDRRDPAEVTITPEYATHLIGDTHEMTVTVRDFGVGIAGSERPVAGASLEFAITGSVTTQWQCTTNDAGQCTLSYGGVRVPATDHITVWADISGDGVLGLGEPSTSATVVWRDDEPPAITSPPGIVIPTAFGACSAPVSAGALGVATASDNSGVVTITAPAAGVYPLGSTALVWSATDGSGNTATATQTVTVVDRESPAMSAPSAIIAGNDPGRGYATIDARSATASDNCEVASIIGIRSDGRGLAEPYPVGVTTIVWTATDASGNATTAMQTVTVNDVERPVISVPPGLIVNATAPSGATVTYGVSATDNVDVLSPVCAPPSESTLPIGSTEVTCTAIDAAGNAATRAFSVTVLGAAEQIVNLIEDVKEVVIPSPYRTSLLTLLQRVLSDPRAVPYTCSALEYFTEAVRSKSGTLIPAPKAAQMIADATRIRRVRGCV